MSEALVTSDLLTPTPWPAPIEWTSHARVTIAVDVPLSECVTGKRAIAEFSSKADAAHAVTCVNLHDELTAACRLALAQLQIATGMHPETTAARRLRAVLAKVEG